MAIVYVFRRPRFPVIVVVEARVFRARSSPDLEKLLRRELKPDANIRLLDSDWAWFRAFEKEALAVAPMITSSKPTTKEALIDLVNGRANRAEGTTGYERRSLSSRGCDEIFREFLAILPAS